MIGIERKFQLIAAGYTVEDKGAVWGADFAGQYRWINNQPGHVDGFGVIQYSEEDAWADADQFEARYGY